MSEAAATADLVARSLARHPARTVEAGSGKLSYRESGSGEALVLLHGIGSASASWVPFMDVAASNGLAGLRLVAWDAPGYGGSTPLAPEKPKAADYAGRLAAMLDALRVDRLSLVGHSLGALMAGAFAAAHPDRVNALILLDPASGYGAATEEARNRMRDGRLGLLRDLGPQGMAEQRGSQLLSPAASAEALEWVRSSMRQVDPAGYTQAVHMLAGGTLAEDARRYEGPAIVMCGSADTVTPEEGCRRIAEALPRGQYRTLPGLGHASYVESPGTVARELAGFLNAAGARP
jgi:pimeloyl-ACP methyl ester carboxylesterase